MLSPSPPLGHSTSECFHLLGTFFLLTICIFSHFSLSFLGFGVAIPPPHGTFPLLFPLCGLLFLFLPPLVPHR